MWFTLLACADRSDPAYAARHLGLLQPVLASMVARRVDFARDQGWCRALSYDRGDFVDTSNPSTCVLDPNFDAAEPPLDAEARRDLEVWSDGLSAAGAPIHWVFVGWDAGRPVSYEVALSGWSRLSWEWAPTEPPEQMGSEVVVRPVPGWPDWYVVIEDWN
ncbi:MAG: hypothetical protein ABMA64_20180 [Myxococcota bacterium]